MTIKRISVFPIAITVLTVVLLTFSCSGNAPESEKAPSSGITADLSIPPPGSPATQEKWDGFDQAKKEAAWAGYLAQNSETPAAKTPTVSVTVGELTKAPISLYYYGLGELKAGEESRISPLVSGTVASLYVSEGDFVEKGDLLFSLDDSDLVRDLELVSEKWNTELELAQIRLNDALSNYESSSSLFARDLISRAENDAAAKAWEEAVIAYEKVRLAKAAEIGKLQQNLRTTISLSPGRGYISEISFKKDEQVNISDFIEIVDIEHLAISIQVPENIIPRVTIGSEVLAKQASAPAYSLQGEVSGKGIVSDSNRSYEVLADLENPDQRLLPGMLMEVQIRIVQLSSNFIIPKESLIQDGTDHFIFTIVDDTARRLPVTTGQSRGNLIQVNGDLKEGDLLVLQGQTYLREGMAVKITETRTYLPERREL